MCSNRDMNDQPARRQRVRRLWNTLATMGMLAAVVAAMLPCHAAEPPIAVRPVDHAELMDEVAKHRGKVVVLDCWSTSCPPCVKEFPGLVRLANTHPDAIVCLSLALDYEGVGAVEEVLPPVAGFLDKVDARAVVNMLSREEADAMYRKLDLASVPAVFIWRADGSLAMRFDEESALRTLGRPFTYADIDATVRDLLTSAPH